MFVLRVTLTSEHLEGAKRHSSRNCPVMRAIQEAFASKVMFKNKLFYIDGKKYKSKEAEACIFEFDNMQDAFFSGIYGEVRNTEMVAKMLELPREMEFVLFK